VYFDGLNVEEKFGEIATKHGYKISGHWLQLYGLCPDCLIRKENLNES